MATTSDECYTIYRPYVDGNTENDFRRPRSNLRAAH